MKLKQLGISCIAGDLFFGCHTGIRKLKCIFLYGNWSTNIIAAAVKEVRAYAESNHYKKDDFREIIHIIDMDGAYIPDSNIIEDEQTKGTECSLTDIRTRNIEKIVQRNSLRQMCQYPNSFF